ncbi:archemetzincin [Candidatus Thorarchaeota archaeon]|nr:MAG: archemetzincin [Candidatus Thorarchaeota archaeon]
MSHGETVELVAFEKVTYDLLRELRDALTERIPLQSLEVRAHREALSLPDSAFNSARGQYDAHEILSILASKIPRDVHALGVVPEDLFVPRLNFVFGIAQRGGNAVIATVRLKPEFYGGASNQELFVERAVKEAVHELGHVFGLSHCDNDCVMRFSNSLPETDAKPSTFCEACKSKLEHVHR